MTKQAITKKQQELLRLIYRHRFIDRTQMQALMGHSNKRRIGIWLKDLREQHYVEWIYSTDFIEKTKPAIYYLGLNGVRFLKQLGEYPDSELRLRYKDANREPDFIARSLLVAGSCVNLKAQSVDTVSYTFVVAADWLDTASKYRWLAELKPHLAFVKTEHTQGSAETTLSYLVEIFDPTTPRYMVRKRLKDYVEYLDDSEWRRVFATKPIILIACPTIAELIYAKRRTETILETVGRTKDMQVRFGLTGELKSEGVTGAIWETD